MLLQVNIPTHMGKCNLLCVEVVIFIILMEKTRQYYLVLVS